MRAFVRLGLLLSATALACERAPAPATAPVESQSSGTALFDKGGNAGSLAFGPQEKPYGRSMVEWSERWWRWGYRVPASENPLLVDVEPDCANGQRGHVWNLPISFASPFSRTCDIPSSRAIVVNLSGVLNDYPCPDTSFHPAKGQTLYQFLIQGAAPIVNAVFDLTLTVDGRAVPNAMDYRFTSPRLFDITGNPTLQPVLDGCITGKPQPAISDGYFVMLRPLPVGTHTIITSGADPNGPFADTITVHSRHGDSDHDGDDGE